MIETNPFQIYGIIQSIDTEDNNGKIKKVVTLKAGNSNLLFIEFQGKTQQYLSKYKTNDKVLIDFRYNGKQSKLGRKYNNIIAKNIKRYANNN